VVTAFGGTGVMPRAAQAKALAEALPDPEIPVLTLGDLGVVRGVEEAADGALEVALTPTYSGCPATQPIADQVAATLAEAGLPARIRLVLSPAWSTDWISEAGRRKLHAYGIAPPSREPPLCPHCGSAATEQISEFGSTPCKALWRCTACREPFDRFKCL
jgi:ring-1,2-phenylacetyl-CoA epoxidase subunit PaaD